MMSEPVLTGVPDLEIVVFQWSRKFGDCNECGLPAAYQMARRLLSGRVGRQIRLCSVCAANLAADGEEIMRIEEG